MNFIPKVRIQWNEPEAFRRAEDHRFVGLRRWRPLATLLLAGLVMLMRQAALLIPGKTPPNIWTALALALFTGVLLVYLVPWTRRRMPSSVFLFPTGLKRGGNEKLKAFNEFTGFEWLAEDSYFVLILLRKKGNSLRFGVPDLATRDEIETELTQAGLKRICRDNA